MTERQSAGGASVVTDAQGYYLVTGTGNGSYTVRASMAGFYFTPFSRQVTVSGAGATAQDFAATAGSFAPPPVPDGSATGYSPLAASKGDAAGTSIHLSWDTTCPAGGYRLVYGMGSQLPASAGGTYGLSGSQCAMGTSPGTWSGAPDPSGDSRKFLWFLMVATDGSTTEGPWGKASGGLERTGPGAQGSSGQCGANAKNTSSTCGSAPLRAEGQNEAWPDAWNENAATAQPEAFVLQNPTAYFYAWDHLGTVRLVTDSVGAVVDKHDFEPYGVEIRPLQNASLNTLRYTGYERDEATGLDYAHFRFLASTLGRFMKPDNIMGNPLNPQSWNLYSYVGGNPVNFNDPTGHEGASPEQSIPRYASGNLGINATPDLDDYLWGGAVIQEGLSLYTMKDGNGNVLSWGYLAPGDIAPSFPSGKAIAEWLEKVVGVPHDKVKGVIKDLKKEYGKVGMGPERALVIAVNPNGDYRIFSTQGTGVSGTVLGKDIQAAYTKATNAGYSVVAAGHEHPFSKASSDVVRGNKQEEGASRADASGYAQAGNTWVTNNPGAYFVLTSLTVYSFNSPPIPNPSNPKDPYTFTSYSW